MERQDIVFNTVDDIQPLLGEITETIALRLKKDSSITQLFQLVMGILNRTYELTESGIWAVTNSRPQTAAFMVRGLHETLAFIFYVKKKLSACSTKEEYDEVLNQLLFGTKKEGEEPKAVNILTCINKASKQYVELEMRYNEISEVVHPNSASHFYVGKPVDEEKMEIELRIPFYEFKGIDKEAMVNQIGECVFHSITICRELLAI